MTTYLPAIILLGFLLGAGLTGWRGWGADTRDPAYGISPLLAPSRSLTAAHTTPRAALAAPRLPGPPPQAGARTRTSPRPVAAAPRHAEEAGRCFCGAAAAAHHERHRLHHIVGRCRVARRHRLERHRCRYGGAAARCVRFVRMGRERGGDEKGHAGGSDQADASKHRRRSESALHVERTAPRVQAPAAAPEARSASRSAIVIRNQIASIGPRGAPVRRPGCGGDGEFMCLRWRAGFRRAGGRRDPGSVQ